MISNYLSAGVCDPVYLAAISSADSQGGVVPRKSRVNDLIIRPNTAPLPIDWTDENELLGIVNNAVTDNSAAKHLKGIGEVPRAQEIAVQYSKGKRRTVRRIHRLTFQTNVECLGNYTLLEQLRDGFDDFTFYFKNLGGRWFGGSGGYDPINVNAFMPLERGATSREFGVIEIDFDLRGVAGRNDIVSIPGQDAEFVKTLWTPDDSQDIMWTPDDSENTMWTY